MPADPYDFARDMYLAEMDRHQHIDRRLNVLVPVLLAYIAALFSLLWAFSYEAGWLTWSFYVTVGFTALALGATIHAWHTASRPVESNNVSDISSTSLTGHYLEEYLNARVTPGEQIQFKMSGETIPDLLNLANELKHINNDRQKRLLESHFKLYLSLIPLAITAVLCLINNVC